MPSMFSGIVDVLQRFKYNANDIGPTLYHPPPLQTDIEEGWPSVGLILS